LSVDGVEESLEAVGDSEEGTQLPAPSHLAEVGVASDNLQTEEETGEHRHVADTVVGLEDSLEVFSVLEAHVAGEEVSETGVVTVCVELFEAIVGGLQSLEPGSTGVDLHTAEVAHSTCFVQDHICL